MYRQTLMSEWENLYHDFSAEYDSISKKGPSPQCLQNWYNVRIHRWNSVAYAEGVLLEQQENPEFSKKLLDTLERFRFQAVSPKQERSVGIGVALGLALGAAAAGLLLFLHWSVLRAMLSAAVVFVVVAVAWIQTVQAEKAGEQKRVHDAYVEQLRAYAAALDQVCDECAIQ